MAKIIDITQFPNIKSRTETSGPVVTGPLCSCGSKEYTKKRVTIISTTGTYIIPEVECRGCKKRTVIGRLHLEDKHVTKKK